MTDRVELTDAEQTALIEGAGSTEYIKFWKHNLFAAVESIVAARTAALREEIEEQRQDLMRRDSATYARMQERDAARAELAAANARCAELESALTKYQGTVIYRERRNAIARMEKAEATLDRVEALATRLQKVWDDSATGWQLPRDVVGTVNVVLSDLRAALTPEGKQQGANDA